MGEFFDTKSWARHAISDSNENDCFFVLVDNGIRLNCYWHIGTNNKYIESMLRFHRLQEGEFNEDPATTVERLMKLKQFCTDIIAQTDEKLISYKASVEEAKEILDAKFEEDIRQLTLDDINV